MRVTVVLVPFDPEEKWSQKPIRLDARRHGWLITGTANGMAFEGFIGERWSLFFTGHRAHFECADPRARTRAGESNNGPKHPRSDAIDPPNSR